MDALLGKKAKDKISGVEGIIVAKIDYLFGCAQYGIVPPAQDGKRMDTEYFDEGRIEITGCGITPEEVQSAGPGGEMREHPKGR